MLADAETENPIIRDENRPRVLGMAATISIGSWLETLNDVDCVDHREVPAMYTREHAGRRQLACYMADSSAASIVARGTYLVCVLYDEDKDWRSGAPIVCKRTNDLGNVEWSLAQWKVRDNERVLEQYREGRPPENATRKITDPEPMFRVIGAHRTF